MEYNKEDNYGCPQEIVDTIRDYVEKKLEPGSFVRAVLENDLCTAMFQAHPLMLPYIKNVCMYVWWEIPAEYWGSKEKVDRWLCQTTVGEWITLRQRMQDAMLAEKVANSKYIGLLDAYKTVCKISEQQRVEIEDYKLKLETSVKQINAMKEMLNGQSTSAN